MKKLQKKSGINKFAFTLVELIVVITILVILGTISFISLQGYSAQSRDSTRISDLSSMKTSLELFYLDAGKYPLPSNGIDITYSGGIVWIQGLFGDSTYKNVGNLDKIPTDPLTNKKYVYSTTNTKQEFQLAGIMEGDDISMNKGVSKAFAGDKTARVRIVGNYNGKISKISTGGLDCVLALPSIITSGENTDIDTIISNNELGYNGYKNLPVQYKGGRYNILGDLGINLVNTLNYEVFCGDITKLSSSDQVGIDLRKNILKNLQNAYTGTIIKNIGEIDSILSIDSEIYTETELLMTTIVTNNLGGDIIANLDLGESNIPFVCGNTVSALGETYTTILGPDGNCWTSQYMRHGNMLATGGILPSDSNTIEKWCYDDTPGICDLDGGLYTWSEAMGFDATCNSISCPQIEDTTKSVCGQLGDGWSLANYSQWIDLGVAGATGWPGNQFSGIVSLIAGERWNDGTFNNRGVLGFIWVSTENSVTRGTKSVLFGLLPVIDVDSSHEKESGYSLVCIKN